MSFGTISHALAAAAFSLLAVLLFVSWKGRPLGGRFIVAAAATAVWATMGVLQAYRGLFPFHLIYAAELLRDGAWLAVLLGIGRVTLPRAFRVATPLLWGLLFIWAVAASFFPHGSDTEVKEHTLLLSRSGLALALLGLVVLEQIYRNSAATARRGLRYLVLGVGGLFAYDLFLYSQAELLRAISADAWNARGLINALLVPVIAVAVRRNPEWSLDIFVSRHVVFYTGTFMAVGIYLLIMAIGGFYVRTFGGSWGGIAQILFLAGSGIVLMSLIFSAGLRARFKVFLSKHFYSNKYDYRIEWLRFVQTLSTADEQDVAHRALRAVAQIFSSPGGVLFSTDESGRRFVPSAAFHEGREQAQAEDMGGLSHLAIDANHELVRLLTERQWVVDLQEYRSVPDVYRNIDIPAQLQSNTALRIVSPLLARDRLVGFMVLYDPPSPFNLTYEDRDLLKTVGRHAAVQIAQHEADRKLAESRQFETYNRLTAFMMHDLKNSAAQLQLLVANSDRHKRNPAFVDDAISTIANTAERIARLIAQLRGEDTAVGVRPVDLQQAIRTAVERCSGREPMPRFVPDAQASAITVEANSDKLLSVIENLLHNAQDATCGSGSIAIRLRREAGAARIDIEDDGCGMDPQFVRERLFRPFDSTKGSKGMGIGAYQAREYMRSLGGEVEVQSNPGQGTTFSIKLPIKNPVPAPQAREGN